MGVASVYFGPMVCVTSRRARRPTLAQLLCGLLLGGLMSHARAVPWSIELLYGDDEIFPSALVSVVDSDLFPPRLSYQRGDPSGLVAAQLEAPEANCEVRVTVADCMLFEESSITLVLPEKGRRYRLAPNLKLRHENIFALHHPIPSELLTVTLRVGANPPETLTKKVKVHPVDDCLTGLMRGSRFIDTSYLAAAYVNENNPEIPAVIIREALRRAGTAAPEFRGYAGKNCVQEIQRIYEAIHALGFRYSHLPQASIVSRGVESQHIRFASEAMRSTQANCIDGSALFAATLTRLGYRVVLFLIPYEHAFMGVYPTPEASPDRLLVIETTDVEDKSFAEALADGAARLKKVRARIGAVARQSDAAGVTKSIGLGPGVEDISKQFFEVDLLTARTRAGVLPIAELAPRGGWIPGLRPLSRVAAKSPDEN